MIIYYILLFSSALIFSISFSVTKEYQRYKGDSVISSIKLTLFANIVVALMFYLKSGLSSGNWSLSFSWFTLLITLCQAFVVFIGVYIGMKVLKIGDMSIYSMFMMLGNIILPSLAGFLYGESIGDRKIIGMTLMIVSLLLSLDSVEKKRMSLKVVLYYLFAFISNGMMGVLLTIHQKNPSITAGAAFADGIWNTNSDTYMTWYGISAALLSIALLVVLKISGIKSQAIREMFKKPTDVVTAKSSFAKIYVLLIPIVYGLCLGFGDYFISLGTAPGALGSSLCFPIVNGGTILFSTLMGAVFYKEKINFKIILSLIVVFCSTMLFMFSLS